MKRTVGVFSLCLGAALASSALAEPPAGEYTISVPAQIGLVFPSGAVPNQCIPTSEGTVCIASDVETDGSGQVTGTADLTLSGPVDVDIDLVLDGAIAGSTAKPKAVLDFTADGTATDGDVTLDVEGAGRMKCKLDANPSQLFCKGKAKVCAFDGADRLGCARLPFATVLEFERTPFDIHLVLATDDRNVVTGDADVLIDAVPAASYLAQGKYKPTADTTNLKLTGTDPALKTKIALKKGVLADGGASAGTLVFKVAGQTGKVEIAP